MTNLCTECLYHPRKSGEISEVGRCCKLLLLPLARSRTLCRGDLWEEGCLMHAAPVAGGIVERIARRFGY